MMRLFCWNRRWRMLEPASAGAASGHGWSYKRGSTQDDGEGALNFARGGGGGACGVHGRRRRAPVLRRGMRVGARTEAP